MQLKAAVQGHASFDALQAIQKDRFSDEVDEQSNLSIKQACSCLHIDLLRHHVWNKFFLIIFDYAVN